MPKKISPNFRIKDQNLSEQEKVLERQEILKKLVDDKKTDEILLDDFFNINFSSEIAGKKNCENLTGSIEIPVGLAGPVEAEIFGDFGHFVEIKKTDLDDAKTNLLLPLATTEGALVASINRGCKALNSAGNTVVHIKKVGITRGLTFKSKNLKNAVNFVKNFENNLSEFINLVESTSSHLKFISHNIYTRGRLVFMRFAFDSDEAMGMNMLTIGLGTAWEKLKEKYKEVELVTLSGNICTDKKDSAINRILGRGFFVQVESFIEDSVLEEVLNVKADDLLYTHLTKNLVGSNVAGSMSQNMHVANALAAVILATGQDPAHIVSGSEASIHYEKYFDEETRKSGVYVALTMPSVTVGSVGGGTWFPKQKTARNLIDYEKKFGTETPSYVVATACGLAALAGEISGLASLTNHTLAKAHATLGRNSCLI